VRFAPLCLCGLLILQTLPAESPKAPRPFELKALQPAFWKLVDHDAKMTRVATGFGFTEGPAWDDRGRFLYVSDEVQNNISRVYPDGRREPVISLGNPDGNTIDRKGRLIDCASDLRAVIEVKTDGTNHVLADHFEGRKLNTPNDIVTGPDGALYFTDPAMDLRKGEKEEQPWHGIYRLDSENHLTLLSKDFKAPNGLAFSPDGKTFYVDDDDERSIYAFRFADGTLSDKRLFGAEIAEGGVPDGMRVDKAGNLFVVGPLGIWVWNSRGEHLGTIVVPEQPANLEWGDADRRTLYITATTSVYRIRTKVHGFVPSRVW
jgi:gluconolactonase